MPGSESQSGGIGGWIDAWGASWNPVLGGSFTMSWDTLGQLLDQDGDVTVGVAS